MTAKMPTMPLSMMVRESRNAEKLMDMCCLLPLQPKSRADECHDQPAGDDRTNLPGDIRARCMHEQEVARLSSSRPILWTTRDAIGNAEMPAAPIIGLILFLLNRLRNLAKQYAADGIKDEGR